MTLGDIIKSYRSKYGLSMDSFSDKSGISKAYISLLEKNKHPKTGKENEKDNDMTSITITPPTGLLNNKVFIVSASAIILVALASGIYFIKKRILE